MGVDRNIKIGPYIQIINKLKVTIPKVKRVCPNHSSKETKNEFCAECGTEIINVPYDEIQEMSGPDYLHRIIDNDNLYSPEYTNFILPNISTPQYIKVDYDDFDCVDLTNIDVIKDVQINWFNATFKKEIDMFIEAFGVDNVKVGWGICTYWA
jgi:hypothetical protein